MQRLRFFSNWTPGAIWTPPKQFYTVKLTRELERVREHAIKANQCKLEEYFDQKLTEYFKNTAKSVYPRKKCRGSSTVGHAINILMAEDKSPVSKIRASRLNNEFSEPPIEIYNAFLQQLYDKDPDPKKISAAYRLLPAPRPRHMDPQFLDDMLQILISMRHSKETPGHLYRTVIDDMDQCKMPVTSRERALYLLSLGHCDMEDIQQVGNARAKISEKMISWHRHLSVDDYPTLNTLLELGLRLDLSILEDFVQNQVLEPNSETYRKLLKSNKLPPEVVVRKVTLSPTLLLNVLGARLRSENPEAAEDFLSHILAEHRNTCAEPSSPRDSAVLHQLGRSFDLITKVTGKPVIMPLVPSMGLFMLFLSHFTRTQNFPKIQRTLVQMASYGCYPPTYALYKILANFNGRWGIEEMDKLIYYICDLSLYHQVMTIPLARYIAKTYRQFKPEAAKELEEFLIGLVGTKTKQVPVIKTEIIPELPGYLIKKSKSTVNYLN